MTTDLQEHLLRLAADLESAARSVGAADVEDDEGWQAAHALLVETRAALYTALRQVTS